MRAKGDGTVPRLVAGRLDKQHHDVGASCRVQRDVVHPSAQARAGFVNAGRVDEQVLRIAFGDDAANRFASGLWMGTRDGKWLADERIEQCALAYVGSSDQGDVSRSNGGGCFFLRRHALGSACTMGRLRSPGPWK